MSLNGRSERRCDARIRSNFLPEAHVRGSRHHTPAHLRPAAFRDRGRCPQPSGPAACRFRLAGFGNNASERRADAIGPVAEIAVSLPLAPVVPLELRRIFS